MKPLGLRISYLVLGGAFLSMMLGIVYMFLDLQEVSDRLMLCGICGIGISILIAMAWFIYSD